MRPQEDALIRKQPNRAAIYWRVANISSKKIPSRSFFSTFINQAKKVVSRKHTKDTYALQEGFI